MGTVAGSSASTGGDPSGSLARVAFEGAAAWSDTGDVALETVPLGTAVLVSGVSGVTLFTSSC